MTIIGSKRFLLLAAFLSWVCFGTAMASRTKRPYAAPVEATEGVAVANHGG